MPLPFTGAAEAARVLADHYASEPKPLRLRLVYQPDTLRTVRTACPHGTRSVIAAALAPEFPTLARSECAWGHDPVLANAEGHTTLLHFESEPGLFALATELAHLGLAVVSAWPLATFLQALPDEWTATGAMTVLALAPHRAVAHRHPANGVPDVHGWSGESSIAEVSHWLSAILANNPAEPVMAICVDHDTAAYLETFLAEADHPGLESLQFGAVLNHPVTLPRYHPAQLLPPPPLVTVNRMAIAAGFALLLSAAAVGALGLRTRAVAHRDQQATESEIRALTSEVAHLRENATAISALRSLIAAGTGAPPHGELLERIGRTVPPGIVLDQLRFDGRHITARGWLTPAAPDAVVGAWRTALVGGERRWTLESSRRAGGAFDLTGVFAP